MKNPYFIPVLTALVAAQLIFTMINFDWDTTHVSRAISIAIFLTIISKSGSSTAPPVILLGGAVLFVWSFLLWTIWFFQLVSDHTSILIYIGGIVISVFGGIGYCAKRFSIAQACVFFLAASTDLGIFIIITSKCIPISPIAFLALLLLLPVGATIFSLYYLRVPYKNDGPSQSSR